MGLGRCGVAAGDEAQLAAALEAEKAERSRRVDVETECAILAEYEAVGVAEPVRRADGRPLSLAMAQTIGWGIEEVQGRRVMVSQIGKQRAAS